MRRSSDRQREWNRALIIVTHDRRFLRKDDIVLEIEDGRLKCGPAPMPSRSDVAT